MKTEDLFKYGVTPKEGKDAGKRFFVKHISKDEIVVFCENNPSNLESFKNGTFDIWQPPKSIFDSGRSITWGDLKKAAEQEKLSDDTEFFVVDSSFFGRYFEPACAKLRDTHGKKAIVIY